MRPIQFICLSIGLLLLISAITGIHQVRYSDDVGLVIINHSLVTRTITLMLGLLFIILYFGIKSQSIWRQRLTAIVFFGAICICLWQAIDYALFAETVLDKLWGAISQIGLAVIVYIIFSKVKKPRLDQQK